MRVTQGTLLQHQKQVQSPLLMRGGWAAKKSCMFLCEDFMTASRICSASSNLTEPPIALQHSISSGTCMLVCQFDISILYAHGVQQGGDVRSLYNSPVMHLAL